MKNVELKIKELWKYLRIQDDEILIVQVYNPKTKTDEYLMAEMQGESLSVRTESDFLHYIRGKPFRLIRQRDSRGHCQIPSAKRLKSDKNRDY